MKKLVFLSFFFMAGLAYADIMKSSKEEPVAVKYSFSGLTASTHTILIDLSNTSGFPHKNTGAINIAAINVSIDKLAASSGTLKIGVANDVNISSTNISYFFEATYDRAAAGTEIWRYANAEGYLYRLRTTSSNTTPYLLTNDTLSTTIFQLDVNNSSPTGTPVPAGRGDVLLSFTNNGPSATDISVEVLYNSEP